MGTDLAKRQDLLNKTRDSIMGLYNQIKHNVEVMGITLPDDKKKIISKEMAALEEKLVVVGQFEEKVKVIEDFCSSLKNFDGLSKPSDLAEANALSDKVHSFDKACLDHLKVLETANAAAQKMTTHKEADAEVAAMRERYAKVKAVADEWVKKVDTLVKEWALLDNTVTELNAWVAK